MASTTALKGSGSTGCWTCRLRRKKCDGQQPSCENCTSLEIDCLYSSQKPDWMDNGAKQKERAEELKAQIKRSASRRRERTRVHGATINQGFIVTSKIDFERADNALSESSSLSASQAGDSGLGKKQSASTTPTSSARPSRGMPGWAAAVLESTSRFDTIDLFGNDAPDASEIYLPAHFRGRFHELDFLMKYVDYVFPFLFPYYQPHMLETGRSWILALITNSNAAFHSVLSLSAYFFTVMMSDTYPGQHEKCKSILWDRLVRQVDMTLETIHQDINSLGKREQGGIKVVERAVLMQSIVQYLVFEVILGRSENWNTHLNAAISLAEHMFHPANDDTNIGFYHLLDHITNPTRCFYYEENRYIWSPDQSGFRFYVAYLIYLDIMASTSLEQEPRLARYYDLVLDPEDDGMPEDGRIQIKASRVIGCQNWALIAVSKIAALDSWKKSMKQSGTLSVIDLVQRSNEIYDSIGEGLSNIDDGDTDMGGPFFGGNTETGIVSVIPGYSPRPKNLSLTPTKIWAYAAQIYLTVVVSGWQPGNADIRVAVARILRLLKTVESTAHLRALSWPLCVAGCLVETSEQEQEFKELFLSVGELEALGALGETQRILESVWLGRQNANKENWDIASCLRIADIPVLLI